MIFIGQVAITFKIMPKGPDTDLEKIKECIKEIGDVSDFKEIPIAFGLKMIEVLMIFDDKAGANTDELEEKIKSIEGVSSVEAGDVTLI